MASIDIPFDWFSSEFARNIGLPQSMETSDDPAKTLRGYEVIASNGGQIYCHPGANFHPRGKATIDGGLLIVCEGAQIHGPTFNIKTGGVVVVGPRARLRAVTVECNQNAAVLFGEGTTWEAGAAIISEDGNLTIGRDCMFSSGVVIRNDDGHGIFDLETGELINSPQDVVIGDHVWLGNGARVNKGVVIGAGTVVGQMSVVSGHLDGKSIYAGIPAKKLKDNIGWARSKNFEDIPIDLRGS